MVCLDPTAPDLDQALQVRASLVRSAVLRVKSASPRARLWRMWPGGEQGEAHLPQSSLYPAGIRWGFQAACAALIGEAPTSGASGERLDLAILADLTQWDEGWDHVAPLGHVLVCAPVVALLAQLRLPHTILYVGGDTLGIGWWTSGRGSVDEAIRVLRVAELAIRR